MRVRPLIMDSSALLADIKNESGAEAVRKIMLAASGGIFMHAVNASEVAYHLIGFGFSNAAAFRAANPKGILLIEDMDSIMWQRTAILKAAHKNLALGDCVAISLAESLDGEILTGDRLFQAAKSTATVRLFR